MASFIPKFLLKKLSVLYQNFSFNEFHFQDAVRVLGLDERYTGQVLSKLVDSGWIAKKREVSDARKKIYRIIDVSFRDLMKDTANATHEK
jgi:DNA-binding MarR family transcriptional regulator